jgi:hypothetical protein
MTPYIYRFPGRIWQVIPDPVRPGVAVEYRENRRVGWAWLPAHMPLAPVWIEHPEPWYAGLEGVWDGMVLLHGYEAPDWPVRQGVWAYEGSSGQLAWHRPTLRLSQASEGGFCLQDETGTRHWTDRAGTPVAPLTALPLAETMPITYPTPCPADRLPAAAMRISLSGGTAYQSGDWVALLRETPEHQAMPLLGPDRV